MLASALLALLIAKAPVQPPCCEITAIDARTGIVTARVKGTSRTFQFAVKSPITLSSLKIGQSFDANLTTKEVSLDGRTVCCRVVGVNPPPTTAPCTLPVTLLVSQFGNQVGITAQVSGSGVPPSAIKYRFAALIPLNGHTFYPDPGTPNAPTWLWTPSEAGDYKITANVIVAVPAGSPTYEPATIPCGTASTSYHVSPSTSSTVTLSMSPPFQSVLGSTSVRATVSVPGGPSVTSNTFSFSYAPRWGQPGPGLSGQATIQTPNSDATWILNTQPSPDLYVMKVVVDSYSSTTLIAEGTRTAGAETPNSGYVVLYPPGKCPPPATPADPTIQFGWDNPITPQNTIQPVSARIGYADCVIAGHSLKDIVSDPQLRVRAINVSCLNCHWGLGWQQITLCNMVPPFQHMQTDPILYYLLKDWKDHGCPP